MGSQFPIQNVPKTREIMYSRTFTFLCLCWHFGHSMVSSTMLSGTIST